ncbi:uncharacterized protein MONBRDRAFT_37477 [Monosiga brevicollis MX1]|uniref:Delta(24(24(1)))-sterol reductase n=1 Tax=Monosiga brevicollis TaxID=81824 RepID=A9V1Z6_MONBE|nr:uncharacterized protein MONBRDRAFT_37477 [Monosiga brevicollis MX1]EDQ88527.1 predicted protein [Monosiga brevicollis MX1]|eukprot:XP_001746631.1 hypothetical protein [Monosiga brevicollis MX1]
MAVATNLRAREHGKASADHAVTPTSAPASKKAAPEAMEIEFGGPVGAAFLIIWSHYILFYFWYCLEANKGHLVLPTSMSELQFHLSNFASLFWTQALPTQHTLIVYGIFVFSQLFLAMLLPGMRIKGRQLPTGERLDYLCNGFATLYATLALVATLHILDIWRLTDIMDNLGAYVSTSIIVGNSVALFWYLYARLIGPVGRLSGNALYDFFMGAILNPRVGIVDIKMVAECRWSWLTLLLLTSSAALKEYELYGAISPNMALMVLAHWLYCNATHKGEHYIPATWDIYHEQFGWMLAFWNCTGVPFMYCFQSIFLLKNHGHPGLAFSWPYITFLFALLLAAYFVFDTGNGQKSAFKLPNLERPYVFPNLPYTILKNPKILHTPHGDLLVDGWYKYARKAQYTADIVMALCWGLSCGFLSLTPYFYVTFFTIMIIHRQTRDEARCSKKYGQYWTQYKKMVPAVFIPGLF